MSALRGRQPAYRGPAPRCGRKPREVPGRGLQPDWPWFDGNVLDFPSFSARLSSFVAAHNGRWPDHLLTGLIISGCLPHWLSDKLADLYQWGEMESPDDVQELSRQIFEAAQDPKRALGHIVKQIESWDPALPCDDEAESDLVDKFLDLYELTIY